MPIDLGTQLAVHRSLAGLTVAQVAQRLAVCRQTVWAWEANKKRPRYSTLARLAAAYSLTDAELGSLVRIADHG